MQSKLREKNDDYWAAQVEIQVEEAKAWIAHASGRQGAAYECPVFNGIGDCVEVALPITVGSIFIVLPLAAHHTK